MKTYEFVISSDAIQFDAPSDEVAALASLLVESGQCIAKEVESGNRVIDFALFGGDGGHAERYGRTQKNVPQEVVEQAVAACHSFRLQNGGRFVERLVRLRARHGSGRWKMKPINLLALAILFAIATLGGRWNVRRPVHQVVKPGVSIAPLVKDRWAK